MMALVIGDSDSRELASFLESSLDVGLSEKLARLEEVESDNFLEDEGRAEESARGGSQARGPSHVS